MQRDGARIGVATVDDLRLRYIGNRALFEPIYAGWTTASNSDFFPLLDQHALKARFLHTFSHSMIQWSALRFFSGEQPVSLPNPTPFPVNDSNLFVMKVAQAREVAKWLATAPLDGTPPALGLGDEVALNRQILTFFARGITQCQLTNPSWQRSAQWLAYNVLFNLGRDESSALWQALLQRLPCNISTVAADPFWSFMQAVSQHHFDTLPILAQTVLDNPATTDTELIRFVAFLQALALAQQGQPDAALKVIRTNILGELRHNERSLLHWCLYASQAARSGRFSGHAKSLP